MLQIDNFVLIIVLNMKYKYNNRQIIESCEPLILELILMD